MVQFKGNCQSLELVSGDILLNGPKQIRITNPTCEAKKTLALLKKGVNLDQIPDKNFLKNLNQMGYIKELPEEVEERKTSRQISFLSAFTDKPLELDKSIGDKKLLVLGCGGTGSMIVQALLGHGFQNFILVDHDLVQRSNFNRQLFFKDKHTGLSKVEALKESILDLSPLSDVKTINQKITSSEQVQKYIDSHQPDIIICGADTPPLLIQKWCTEASLNKNVAVVFGGVGIENASLGPLLDNKESKEKYLAWIEAKLSILNPYSMEPVKGSLSSTNLICSAIIAKDCFDYFTKIELGSLINTRNIFDFKSLSITKTESF